MKNQNHIPLPKTEDTKQNKNINEEDVFIREKIAQVRKLNDELTNKVYTKEEISAAQNQKKKKKEKIGMKVLLVNTIIASFAVVILVFHLKGYI